MTHQTQMQENGSEVKTFFNQYYTKQITFPAAQVDAVVGFFLKRGFADVSAKSTAIVLLTQARQDSVNVFKLLDTLTNLNIVQLSRVVTEVLNASRDRTSILGYKATTFEETYETRNIIP